MREPLELALALGFRDARCGWNPDSVTKLAFRRLREPARERSLWELQCFEERGRRRYKGCLPEHPQQQACHP